MNLSLKMAASIRLLAATVFLLLLNRCLAWDNDEFEVFDLVEEVNANFYDVLGVGQVIIDIVFVVFIFILLLFYYITLIFIYFLG
jgi:hypothetical protein